MMMSSSIAPGCSKATENCPLPVQLGALCGQTSEQTRGQFCARTKRRNGQNIFYPIFHSCTSEEGWFWLCWAAVFNRMYVWEFNKKQYLYGLDWELFVKSAVDCILSRDVSWWPLRLTPLEFQHASSLCFGVALRSMQFTFFFTVQTNTNEVRKCPQWSVKSEKFVLMFSETG